MEPSSPQDNILPFPHLATNPWIEAYAHAELARKNEATRDAYLRILHQIASWVADFPGSEGRFHPTLLTRTVFGDYISELTEKEYSASHLARVKTVVNGFALWLLAEGELRAN